MAKMRHNQKRPIREKIQKTSIGRSYQDQAAANPLDFINSLPISKSLRLLGSGRRTAKVEKSKWSKRPKQSIHTESAQRNPRSSPSNSASATTRVPKDITTICLALAGWETSNLPDDLNYCHVKADSLLPSPLGTTWEEIGGSVEAYPHGAARLAYKAILSEKSNAKTLLADKLSSLSLQSSEPSAIMFFLRFAHTEEGQSEPRTVLTLQASYWEESGQSMGSIAMFVLRNDTYRVKYQPLTTSPRDDLPRVDSLGRGVDEEPSAKTNTSHFIQITRLTRDQNRPAGFFLINPDMQSIAVNESKVGAGTIAGPLPPFALITIGIRCILWLQESPGNEKRGSSWKTWAKRLVEGAGLLL